MPNITVFPIRAIRGWDKGALAKPRNKPPEGPEIPCKVFSSIDVHDALGLVYDTDAHFVPYRIEGAEKIPRVNYGGLRTLLKAGGRLVYDTIVFDLDAPGHGKGMSPEAVRSKMREYLEAMRVNAPDLYHACGWYTTRGGMRLLWEFGEPCPVDLYVPKHRALRALLREAGVPVDECKDFGRLYRLPHVVRDGKRDPQLVYLDALDALPDLPELRVVPEDPTKRSRLGAPSGASKLPSWATGLLGPMKTPPGAFASEKTFELPIRIAENRNETLVRVLGWARRHGADVKLLRQLVGLYVRGGLVVQGDDPITGREIENMLRNAARWEPGTLQGRELLTWDDTKLSALAERCATLLGGSGAFQRAGQLVRVGRDDNDALSAFEVKRNALGAQIGLVVELTKWDPRAEEEHEIGIPPKLSDCVRESPGLWSSVPKLKGLADCPIMRPDGSIVVEEGYDAATGFFYDPGGVEYPEIPIAPTRDECREALGYVVRTLLDDYRFERPEHVSVALALPLTVLARPMIDGPTPLVLIDSSTKGSGKGKLANVWSIVTTGRPYAAATIGGTEEAEKRITTILRDACGVCVFDDVKAPIGSEGVLDRLVTADVWQSRILGASQRVSIPNRTIWIATGNNIQVAGDMQRRCLLTRLDPGCERPWEREGLPNIVEIAKRERVSLVAALLTCLRGYVAAGRPRGQGTAGFGSFESWARVVRDCLVWLGMPDPVITNREVAERADFVGDAKALFVDAFTRYFGGREVDARAIMEACTVDTSGARAVTDLREALTALGAYDDAGRTNSVRIGRTLTRFAGGVFGKSKFVRRKSNGRWIFGVQKGAS